MSIFSWLFKRAKAVNAEADSGSPKGGALNATGFA